MLVIWLLVVAGTSAALLIAAALLHAMAKLGLRTLADWFSRAPGLDLWIVYFTVLPLIAGPVAYTLATQAAWWVSAPLGLLGAVLGQMIALRVWCRAHEFANRKSLRGPRLVKQINATVGPVRGHFAVWWTALAVPVFAIVRLAEIVVYPVLTWTVHLPRYRTADWVNVSRHKFEGLVGHDLIWCLYCDWMTGVWALGSEMLRNIESFWCPIRFHSDKKCENCAIDFPDVEGGWVPANGGMGEVVAVHHDRYPGPGGVNSWFGHPGRKPASLTVNGAPVASPGEGVAAADRAAGRSPGDSTGPGRGSETD